MRGFCRRQTRILANAATEGEITEECRFSWRIERCVRLRWRLSFSGCLCPASPKTNFPVLRQIAAEHHQLVDSVFDVGITKFHGHGFTAFGSKQGCYTDLVDDPRVFFDVTELAHLSANSQNEGSACLVGSMRRRNAIRYLLDGRFVNGSAVVCSRITQDMRVRLTRMS